MLGASSDYWSSTLVMLGLLVVVQLSGGALFVYWFRRNCSLRGKTPLVELMKSALAEQDEEKKRLQAQVESLRAENDELMKRESGEAKSLIEQLKAMAELNSKQGACASHTFPGVVSSQTFMFVQVRSWRRWPRSKMNYSIRNWLRLGEI